MFVNGTDSEFVMIFSSKKMRLLSLPKAACRRVAVTPPPPASRRPGGGGVTAYMPRKAACWQWSAEGRKEAGGRGDEERDEAEEKKVELAT